MSSKPLNNPPDLDKRFLAPADWQTGEFENPETGHKIHYGFVLPENPKGCVVVLPGLSEFTEKYYETAHDLLARNLGVFVIDWHGQGRSSRGLSNPHKRHSISFDRDISDLHHLISKIVHKKTSVPLTVLAHSMGGNLAIRYMLRHPDAFKAAAFSAPMLGISDLARFPDWTLKFLLWLLYPFLHFYIPGGKDWHEAARKSDGSDIFSSDPERDSLHNTWSSYNPVLQVGNPTLGWVKAALSSCEIIRNGRLENINTPCLFVAAEHEKIVYNQAIRDAATRIPFASFKEIQNAKHEILMETDDIRSQFWNAFDKTLQNAIGTL